ncbi:hypothetical protein WG907_11705 [Sphingobium sp. AN558]|uniref:hypothetical protein n=1 Tax=Sphingobium sp. AN558 TaxID=3133442 RepID=UPI0030BE10DC
MRMSDGLIAAGLLCVPLTACGSGRAPQNATVQAGRDSLADDGKADCAIGQGADWARDCRVERSDTAEGPLLTLRHPDGGFRRLRIVTDGRGLVPADGAEQAGLSIIGDRRIELAVGSDRYRLPATIAAPRP